MVCILSCLSIYQSQQYEIHAFIILHIGCRFSLAPSKSLNLNHRIAVNIDDRKNITVLKIMGVANFDTDTAIIVYRDQHRQSVSSLSDCQIDNLEVYRGTQQIVEISHAGFSVTNERSIEVTKSVCSLLDHC